MPISDQVNLMLGLTLGWSSIPSRGSRNTLNSPFMLQKADKLQPARLFGLYADFIFPPKCAQKGNPKGGFQTQDEHFLAVK